MTIELLNSKCKIIVLIMELVNISKYLNEYRIIE